MENLKNKFKVGDRVGTFKVGKFRYGIVGHLQPRTYADIEGNKKWGLLATINWYNGCNQLVDSQISWAHKLKLYEPRRHPLTTIFRELPKKERIVSKKRRKRIDKRRKKE